MKCYIKDKVTFANKKIYTVSEYDIVLASIFNDNSKITVNGVGVIEGDFALCDNGYIGIIKKTEPNIYGTSTKLTCIEILNLFDTDIVYANDYFNAGNLEQSFYDMMDLIDWGNYYPRFTGLLVHGNRTNTTPDLEPQAEKDYFNLKEYLEYARRKHNMFTEFILTRRLGVDVLRVDTMQRVSPTHKIDFKNTSYTLISEDYSDEMCSHIQTCLYDELAGNTYHNWYVSNTGVVSTSSVDRAPGRDKVLQYTASENETVKVTEEFNKTRNYSHMIEFSSTKELGFFDLLEIKTQSKIFNSYISSVRVTSGSDRYFYKSGEMRTGIKSQLKELI